MVVLGVLRHGGRRVRRFFGRTRRRAAIGAGAGGLAGGVLLDDVPLVGPTLDPTENPGGGGPGVIRLAILGFLAVAGMLVLDDLAGDGQ